MRLEALVARLRAAYGAPPALVTRDPWEWIVRENVAYLADDEGREEAFRTLERTVGTRPEDLLAARPAALTAVAPGHGILPAQAATTLKQAARVALEEGEEGLAGLLRRPVPDAMRTLERFPGIGEPGAERILLFARRHPVLALDSNGLRVLLRLGYGTEQKSYAATYRSVRAAVEPEAPRRYPWLVAAHLLLRRHGRETCKNSRPRCTACVLVADCPFAAAAGVT